MKAGLSLSVAFVDSDECKPAMRSCLQGTTSKPRVTPSKLVGSPGISSVNLDLQQLSGNGFSSQPFLGFL